VLIDHLGSDFGAPNQRQLWLQNDKYKNEFYFSMNISPLRNTYFINVDSGSFSYSKTGLCCGSDSTKRRTPAVAKNELSPFRT
jgi:hypothetical protein